MSIMAELEEIEPIPSILLPCSSCTRTFRPEALAKHAKVCEKTLMKKRKKFDSAKQRLQGTDVPIFPTPPKPSPTKDPYEVTQKPGPTWRDKQADQSRTLLSTKKRTESANPVKPSDHEQCPYCERYFGPKAYDRHCEWCKEQQIKIRNNNENNAKIEARERLQVRTKYRAPLSKKNLVKDKYSVSSPSVPKLLDDVSKSSLFPPRTDTLRASQAASVRRPQQSPRCQYETKLSSPIIQSNSKKESSLFDKMKPKLYPEATPKKKMLVPPRVTAPRNRLLVKGRSGYKLNNTQVNTDIQELYVSSCVIHDPAEKCPSEGYIPRTNRFMEFRNSEDEGSSCSSRIPQTPRSTDTFIKRKTDFVRRKDEESNSITADKIKQFIDRNLHNIVESPPLSPLTPRMVRGINPNSIAETPEPQETSVVEFLPVIVNKFEENEEIKKRQMQTWREKALSMSPDHFLSLLKLKCKQKAITYLNDKTDIGSDENQFMSDTNDDDRENSPINCFEGDKFFGLTAKQILDELNASSNYECSLRDNSSSNSQEETYVAESNLCENGYKLFDFCGGTSFFLESTSSSSSGSTCSCASCSKNAQNFTVKVDKITEVKDVSTSMEGFEIFSIVDQPDKADTRENESRENDDEDICDCKDRNAMCDKCMILTSSSVIGEFISSSNISEYNRLIDDTCQCAMPMLDFERVNITADTDGKSETGTACAEVCRINENLSDILVCTEELKAVSDQDEDPTECLIPSNIYKEPLYFDTSESDGVLGLCDVNSSKSVDTLKDSSRHVSQCVQTIESSFSPREPVLKFDIFKCDNLISWSYIAKKNGLDKCGSPGSGSNTSIEPDSLELNNVYFDTDQNNQKKIKKERKSRKKRVARNGKCDDSLESLVEEACGYSGSDWDCSSSNWQEECDNFTVHRKKVKYYETIEYKQDSDDYKTVKTSYYELPPLKNVPKVCHVKEIKTDIRPPESRSSCYRNGKLNKQYHQVETSGWPHQSKIMDKNRRKRKSGCMSTIKLPPLKKPSNPSWLVWILR